MATGQTATESRTGVHEDFVTEKTAEKHDLAVAAAQRLLKVRGVRSLSAHTFEGMAADIPWGLSRATDVFDEAPSFYATHHLDPDTQLSVFYDVRGEVIEMGKGSERRYPTITMSKRGDGAKDAPNVADDTENDRDSD